MNMDEADPDKTSIESILSSAERATHPAQGLLAFSRKQVIVPKVLDLNEVVQRVEHFLERLVGEDIELATTAEKPPLMVFADQSQMEQVLINLATNARDAMPAGGIISIALSAVFIAEFDTRIIEIGSQGRHALIIVSDTGHGIDKATIEYIFEPLWDRCLKSMGIM